MAAPHYTPSGKPTEGAGGDSLDIRNELALIEAGIEVLNLYPLSVFFEDANAAADQIFAAVPWNCTIEAAHAAISSPNATTDTILTLKIGGVAVTGGTITIPASSSSGDVYSCTPTALNSVPAGGGIEVETDGAGSSTMSVAVTLVLKRT